MSSQFYGGYIWMIGTEKLESLNMASYQALTNFMSKHDIYLDDVALDCEEETFTNMFLQMGEELVDEIQLLYNQFRAEFLASTGLNIELAYLESDCETGGDFEPGAYWSIDAAMIRPEAQALGITWDNQILFSAFG